MTSSGVGLLLLSSPSPKVGGWGRRVIGTTDGDPMSAVASPPDEYDTQAVDARPARRITKWSHIWAAVLVLLGVVSFLVLAPLASDPNTLSGVRASLDAQQATVTELAGTATVIAAGLSIVPGDALSPVADKLIEVSGWFVVIIVTIFVQKILITVAGSIAFMVIVPLACILAIASIYSGRAALRSLSLRLATFAVVLALAVPASIWGQHSAHCGSRGSRSRCQCCGGLG